MATYYVTVKVYEERDDGEWCLEARVNYGWSSSTGAYYHANPLEVCWVTAVDPAGDIHAPEQLDWFEDTPELRDAATERAHEALREMGDDDG